jgi:S1-C subfamily serine protease
MFVPQPRLSRTIALGLIVFSALLVWTLVVNSRRVDHAHVGPAAYEPVTVVDVARGVDAAALGSLVRLRADERVTAVDDQPVANDFAAGAALTQRALGPGTYVDLTVTGARGSRRVLVLMH